MVAGHDGAGLGESVALHHRQAEADEHARDLRRQRRAAADRGAQTSAQAVQDLLRHQFVQQRPQQERQLPAAASLLVHEALPADIHRQLEQFALERRALFQLGTDRGIDALVDARHGNQDGRLDGLQVFRQQRDGARISDGRARHHSQVIAAGALEGVRQRQEGQHQVIGVHHKGIQCSMRIAQHVVVAEHHAFGLAGGTRGVDDAGQFADLAGHRRLLRRAARKVLRCGYQARFVAARPSSSEMKRCTQPI